jgi:hypothetical protein
MLRMGFTPLATCPCIYKKISEGKVQLIYAYVDDFLFSGECAEEVYKTILQFRQMVDTSAPSRNPQEFLGIHATRLRKKRVILVTLENKIDKIMETLVKNFNIKIRAKHTPMKPSMFITKESEFDKLPEESRVFLDVEDQQLYLSLIGSISWVAGLRHDIALALLYLSWSAKAPRQHHLQQALYTIQYLNRTKYLPLTLGGSINVEQTSYCDAALGNGTRGRSTIGSMNNIGRNAGMVNVKTTVTLESVTSIFEAELEAYINAVKQCKRVSNILSEFNQKEANIPKIYGDNKAVEQFINGNGVAKGVRHMELRQWYMREQYQQGRVLFEHMPGAKNPADKLTKLADSVSHAEFTVFVMGLNLLGATSILNEEFYRNLLISDTIDDPNEFIFIEKQQVDMNSSINKLDA